MHTESTKVSSFVNTGPVPCHLLTMSMCLWPCFVAPLLQHKIPLPPNAPPAMRFSERTRSLHLPLHRILALFCSGLVRVRATALSPGNTGKEEAAVQDERRPQEEEEEERREGTGGDQEQAGGDGGGVSPVLGLQLLLPQNQWEQVRCPRSACLCPGAALHRWYTRGARGRRALVCSMDALLCLPLRPCCTASESRTDLVLCDGFAGPQRGTAPFAPFRMDV